MLHVQPHQDFAAALASGAELLEPELNLPIAVVTTQHPWSYDGYHLELNMAALRLLATDGEWLPTVKICRQGKLYYVVAATADEKPLFRMLPHGDSRRNGVSIRSIPETMAKDFKLFAVNRCHPIAGGFAILSSQGA